MDARAIRTANLRQLIREAGGVERLAERAATSRKTLEQILAGTPLPSGAPRGIGHKLARRLEIAGGKPSGWLDVAHDETLPEPVVQLIELIRTRSIESRLTAEQARALYAIARAM